jgi:CCR4-NOT transcription complex subunit 1
VINNNININIGNKTNNINNEYTKYKNIYKKNSIQPTNLKKSGVNDNNNNNINMNQNNNYKNSNNKVNKGINFSNILNKFQFYRKNMNNKNNDNNNN